MLKQNNILVLGSASWLGSLLLSKKELNFNTIVGTFFNVKLFFDSHVSLAKASTLADYEAILATHKFDIIINFLRGENDEGFAIHKAMLSHCESHSSYYLYCSSALALDAYTNTDLKDDLLAKSNSPYGMFKAKCERLLYDSTIDWSILRFSSLQGYCAHKQVRNEVFLSKLKKGETIKVDKNIVQNRMVADDAVDIIVEIIKNRKKGIVHLGTSDSSDEIDFLKRQAELFGYDSGLIVQSDKNRNVNLNCIPSQLDFMDSTEYPYPEVTTLKKIAQIKHYKEYLA